MNKILPAAVRLGMLFIFMTISQINFGQSNSNTRSPRPNAIAKWPQSGAQKAITQTGSNANTLTQSIKPIQKKPVNVLSSVSSVNAVAAGAVFYVNDGSTTGDHYTATPGMDLPFPARGTQALPFATINYAIGQASAGDTIYVDAGIYREDVIVTKSLSFKGSNFGSNPNNAGARFTESEIQPATSNTDEFTLVPFISLASAASGTLLDGFIVNGDNTTLTSGVVINSADINATEGITAFDGTSNVTVSNNIVKNLSSVGIDFDNFSGVSTTGNLVTNNKLDNIAGSVFGIGVLIYDNCYTSITTNVMTRVRIGVQTGNYYQADLGNSHSIATNFVESSILGIWHNLVYSGASTFNITTNAVTTLPGAAENTGFAITSLQQTVGVNVSGNNAVTGARIGFELWNNPTTNTVSINGATINSCKIGVFPNNYDGYNSNAESSNYSMSNVILMNTDTAIWIRDNQLNSNGATVALNINSSNSIGNSSGTGILIEGCDASVSFGTTFPLNFVTALSKYIRQISNGTCVPALNINAQNVMFFNQPASSLSLGQLFAIEDRIDHKIDLSTLGFVSIKANNNYVTVNSFYSPSTTTPSIQRAIDAASTGFIVNVGPGNYVLNSQVNINKEISLFGQNSGISPVTGTRVAEADLDFTSDPNSSHIIITAFGAVQIKGLRFQDNLNFSSGDRIVISPSSAFNHVIQNNIFFRSATGSNGGNSHAILTGVSSNILIDNNYVTGSNTALFNNTSWRRGFYITGGTGTISITNNRFLDVRSHVNVDFNKNVILSGNKFELGNTGTTAIAFGGASGLTGNYTLGSNEFSGNGTYINLSDVDPTFRVDATSSKSNGTVFSALSLADQFALEAKIIHATNIGKNGFVIAKPGNVYVITTSPYNAGKGKVQLGNNIAQAGNVVNVADGTYLEDIEITKALTLLGQSRNGTILKGMYTGKAALYIKASDVTVKDLTVSRDYQDWYNSTKTEGVIVENFDRMTLDNILVKDNRNGVLIFNCKDFIIKNSAVESNRTGFQVFGPLNGGQITNNFIRNNFTHGFLVNFDQGVTTLTNLKVNNNDISGNWYSQINFQRDPATPASNVGDLTGLDMTCNWYGTATPAYSATATSQPGYTTQVPSQLGGTDPGENSDIRGTEAARIPYIPFLTSGTDNDGAAPGFQPVPGTCGSDIEGPSAPTNLQATYTGRTFANLDWNNSTDNIGVTGYDVYRNGVLTYTSPTSDVTANNLTPNTSYTFTVKARDAAGNTSAFSNAIQVTTKYSGLDYRVVQGTFDVLPDFNTLTPVKTGNSPNVDISVRPAGLDDRFAIVWEGYINIPAPGVYTFETISDDGSKFYFNTLYNNSATALVDNDGVHAARSRTGTINIPVPGLYPVAITFFERVSGETMQVFWSSSNFARQPIPNSAFSDDSPPPQNDNVVPSTPTNLVVVSTGNNFITLDWGNSTDNVGVAGYDIFRDGVLAYTSTESQVIANGLSPNTSYVFKVRARDFAGNVSGFSNEVTGQTSTTTSGLDYRYYEGNFDVLPNFNTLTPVQTGTTPNVNIGVRPASRNDQFAFVFEGYINIPTAGNYIFETISDDGSRLYFNTFYNPSATPTVDNDGLHGPRSRTGAVNGLAVGSYPISITFFEKFSGETMQVYWTRPDGVRELIPNSAFTNSNPPPPPPMGLTYKYYEGNFDVLPNFNNITPVQTGTTPNVDINVRPLTRNDQFAFTWEGYINIPTAGTYTFETISDDGSRLYFNTFYNPSAAPTVDNDGLHGPRSRTGTVGNIAAGAYPISITFFEKFSGETMEVYWTGPGITRERIPNSAFSQNPPSPIVNRIDMSNTRKMEASASDKSKGAVEITNVYPNPFVESFNINFYNSASTNDVHVGVYDLKGRLIHIHHAGNVMAGNTTVRVNLGGRQLTKGMYVVGLNINGKASKMVKMMKAE